MCFLWRETHLVTAGTGFEVEVRDVQLLHAQGTFALLGGQSG